MRRTKVPCGFEPHPVLQDSLGCHLLDLWQEVAVLTMTRSSIGKNLRSQRGKRSSILRRVTKLFDSIIAHSSNGKKAGSEPDNRGSIPRWASIPRSSNGRTTDSDSVCIGSNPVRGSKFQSASDGARFTEPLSKVLPLCSWLGAMAHTGYEQASGAPHGCLAQLVVATVS